MRIAAFLTLLFLPMITLAADVEKAIPPACEQLVMVTTADWATSTATLQRFERAGATAPWKPVGKPLSALIGERGMGWGAGLLTPPREAKAHKREGDRRSPAGVFRLTTAFGTAAKTSGLKMPVLPLSPTLEAIDDPASRYYNRIVDRAQIAKPDWKSSERMSTVPDYALGVVIAHNPRQEPGAGSCIFFHLWLGNRRGSAGCTLLREADLATLIRWLDPAREPVLVQLPEAEVPRAISARGS
jgi:D-alanyl-D-alanine dipeptidase